MLLSEVLSGIEKMTIYKKDYDIIIDLINYGDNQLFTKILEEVLMGNLYWSDLETLMANTEYPNILEESLDNQIKIQNELKRFTALRQTLGKIELDINGNASVIEAEDYEYNGKTSMICISDNFVDENGNTFFSQEYSKIRDNLLFEITRSSDSDNLLIKACKIRLYNALKNGELYLKIENGEIENASMDDYEVDETEITQTVGSTTYSYEYINPNDIFLFLNKYYIPLDYRFQTLDSFDETYMKKHDISETTMKQIKALSLYLRRRDYFSD